MEDPGTSYISLPNYPDQRLFRCLPYRGCLLLVGSCAKRWRAAQVAYGERAERISKCRGCELGACHADLPFIYRNEEFGSERCSRCRVGGSRMIGNRICVSCYNREREFKAGANAKGTPVTFAFEPRRIGVIVDHNKPNFRYFEVAEEYTSSVLELVFQIMRVTPGRVAFTAPLGRPAVSTAQLARAVGAKRPRNLGSLRRRVSALAHLRESPPKPQARGATTERQAA